MVKVKALVIGVLMIWLVIGILLAPLVRDIMLSWGTFVRSSTWSIWGYAFIVVILVSIVVVLLVGRVKGVFNRFVASIFLVFHSFPALAWFLEPALYIMVFPVGIFALLCSPMNPLFIFPPARRLLGVVILSPSTHELGGMLLFLGTCLFPLGLVIFTVALIQLLRGKGRLLTSGLYSVIRHPQYLGIILATLGFTFFELEVKLMSLITWIMLVFAYVWLARREETSLQEKYGEEFIAYKRRVSFILPLPTRRSMKREKSV